MPPAQRHRRVAHGHQQQHRRDPRSPRLRRLLRQQLRQGHPAPHLTNRGRRQRIWPLLGWAWCQRPTLGGAARRYLLGRRSNERTTAAWILGAVIWAATVVFRRREGRVAQGIRALALAVGAQRDDDRCPEHPRASATEQRQHRSLFLPTADLRNRPPATSSPNGGSRGGLLGAGPYQDVAAAGSGRPG
jgi:hypothetical protein